VLNRLNMYTVCIVAALGIGFCLSPQTFPQTAITVTFCMDKLENHKWKRKNYKFSKRWRTGSVYEACSAFSK